MKNLTFKVFAAIALIRVCHEERSPKFYTDKKNGINLGKKTAMEKIIKKKYHNQSGLVKQKLSGGSL